MLPLPRRWDWLPTTRLVDQTYARALSTHVWPLLESGAVKPIVHATFPLRQAADAHRLMESSTHIGKLVLTV